ncbi:MAG: formylglycine-generating enzyme family protein [Piscinibacter sp.]|nr:formylglycine-generating enzyme family protein [Piscinibacter sp.]
MHKMLIAVWAVAAALQCAPAWPADAASAPAGGATRGCDACPEMVSIPGGEFVMGSPAGERDRDDDELPQRQVRVKPFALGKTEVTVAQWRQFTLASGYLTEAERNLYEPGCFTWEPQRPEWAWRAGRSWRDPGWGQKDDEPVVCISWSDAQAYVRWLDQRSGVKGWRLPTEAEWEYAARAGSTTRWPWGDDADLLCEHSNGTDRTKGPNSRTWNDARVCRDGHWYTAPVGRYRPNAWGLHDMLGNVWEWVQDCYLPYTGAPNDGSAHETKGCKGRVVRGGAWDDHIDVLRSAERFWLGAGNRNNNIGLRVARTLPP